jgi:predicted metal-dependent phosphotriesterase family hydrolase
MSEAIVQTVTGPADPAELGFTLTAEHFYGNRRASEVEDLTSAWPLVDESVLDHEVAEFMKRGGKCVVDTTPACLGRNPEGLRALSQRTGLAIVMATGWYTDSLLPPDDHLERRTVASLAEQLIREIVDGVGPQQIRPGVIGEFGAAGEWLSPMEERIHRASSRAHLATGIPLSTHALGCDVGRAQLDLFEDEGVELSKVAIGHCDSWPVLDYWLEIAQRGAYVQLDLLSFRSGVYETRLVQLVSEMVERGFSDHLLLSHDMSTSREMTSFGGAGLTHVGDRFLPVLREHGINDEILESITSRNPARFLTMPAPAPA